MALPRRCSASGGTSASGASAAVSHDAGISGSVPGTDPMPASPPAPASFPATASIPAKAADGASGSRSDCGATRHSLAQRAQRSLRGRCSSGMSYSVSQDGHSTCIGGRRGSARVPHDGTDSSPFVEP